MSDWILPSNLDRFDSLLAFRELKKIDWGQDNFKFEKDDVIYIYVSNCKAIRFRCKVTKNNLSQREIDDSKYGESEIYERYSEFTLEKEYSGDCLSYSHLKEKGLNGNLQTATRVNGDLLSYLKSFNSTDFYSFSPTYSIWLATALLTKYDQSNEGSFKKSTIIETALQLSNQKITDEDFNNCLKLADSSNNKCFEKKSRRYKIASTPRDLEGFTGNTIIHFRGNDLNINEIISFSQSASDSEKKEITFSINERRVFIIFQGSNYDTEYRNGYIQAKNGPTNENGIYYHYWKRIEEVKENDIIFNLASGYIKAISIATEKCQQVDDAPDINRVCCNYHTLENQINYKDLKEDIKKAYKGFGKYCPFNKNGEGNQGYLYDSNKGLAVLFSKKILDSNEKLGEDLPILKEIISTSRGVEQMDINRHTQIRKYSDTLLKSKNIILHGAPGTGKSFLAKQIAADIVSSGKKCVYTELSDEEKSQIEFVQFHPSYDYTDFVEGLRPKLNDDGSMGFELKEGIFMEFVNRARKNYENSRKSEADIKRVQSVEEALHDYINNLEFGKESYSLKNGNIFFITNADEHHIYVSAPENDKNKDLTIQIEDIRKMLESEKKFTSVKDVREFFHKKNQSRAHSYDLVIYNKIKNNKTKNVEVKKEEEKKYVFIIDEINRGEISKIFGELFYSIDPGYRGKAGEITTQYSNLHDDPEEKFYIPENVYIIGTMNDIDRSVDSFDFAMRRRFRFIELKANDMTGMLDSLPYETKQEAIKRMTSLNRAITTHVKDLNDSYHIGAAYFLKLNEIDSEQLWSDYLEPLLKDYIQGMPNEEEIMAALKNAYNCKESSDEVDADAISEG